MVALRSTKDFTDRAFGMARSCRIYGYVASRRTLIQGRRLVKMLVGRACRMLLDRACRTAGPTQRESAAAGLECTISTFCLLYAMRLLNSSVLTCCIVMGQRSFPCVLVLEKKRRRGTHVESGLQGRRPETQKDIWDIRELQLVAQMRAGRWDLFC